MSIEKPDADVWTLLLDGLDAVIDGSGPAPPGGGPLSRLLARAGRTRLRVRGRKAVIGWALSGDEEAIRRWPPGPVMYRSGSRPAPPDGIMCADPIALLPSGDRLIVHGPRDLALTTSEKEALVAALTGGLAGSGVVFRVRHDQWYLETREPPSAAWWDPDQISGQHVLPYMPTGPSAARLRTVMTEAQMILHEHPVNLTRADGRQLPANGLWPWGWTQGSLPEPVWGTLGQHGEDLYGWGLMDLVGQPVIRPDPAQPGGSALIILQLPAADSGVRSWLRRFDERWCGPLVDAVKGGRIDRLRLTTPAGRCFELRRLDLLRFWRRWRT